MAEASSVIDEEEIDENLLLKEFFQKHYYWLKTVPLSEVPIRLRYEISILFFITTKEDADWMIFLQELGLNTMIINGIAYASSRGPPPLYIAFKLMHTENLGHVMEVFSKLDKFHILRHVKTFVEDLLLKEKNLIQPTAPSLSALSAAEITEMKPKEAKESTTSTQSCFPNANSLKLPKLMVNLPAKDTSIIVFIQHAMSDKKYAKELRGALHKKGFRVYLSADVYPFLRINSAQILRDLNKKVDFIVPLISDELWKQIYSKSNDVVDLETESNRFLYNLVLDEFSSSVKNYRVRPVLNSRKISVPIRKDPILSKPFHLRNEFSEFVRNLKVTKQEYDRINNF